VQNTEIGVSEWQLSVSSLGVSEHEAMTWAVHRLHTESLILYLKDEDVVLVVEVMTGCLPQFEVENVGGDDLGISSNSVLLLNHGHKVVVNPSTFWIHECTSWR